MGLAVGVVAGTLLVAYSKSARELACAGKDFANQKLQNAKEDVEVKTEEIKEKTLEAAKEAEKTPAKKRTRKPSTPKQDSKPKTEVKDTEK